MDTLRVFCNKKGEFSNPVGIVEDLGKKINNQTRLHQAVTSGFSEIVFINDLESKDISIFSPIREIPFAGHAAVGVSYYLRHRLNLNFQEITSMGTTIQTWEENGLTWVRADIKTLPDWNFKELSTSHEVEKLTLDDTKSLKHSFVWAWIDKEKGIVRARTFAPDWKIPEDEANGSGSIKLANTLQRNLEIHHGRGSVVYASPDSVGGLVK